MDDERADASRAERAHGGEVQWPRHAGAPEGRRDDHHVEVADVAEVVRGEEAGKAAVFPGHPRGRTGLGLRDLEVSTKERPFLPREQAVDVRVVAVQLERLQHGVTREPAPLRHKPRKLLDSGQHFCLPQVSAFVRA